MGHYAADMRPEWFDDEPSKRTRSTDHDWVVGDDYTVMRAIDYQNSCGRGALSYMTRMLKIHYRRREDAEVAAQQALMDAFEELQQRLSYLRQVQHNQPWKK